MEQDRRPQARLPERDKGLCVACAPPRVTVVSKLASPRRPRPVPPHAFNYPKIWHVAYLARTRIRSGRRSSSNRRSWHRP